AVAHRLAEQLGEEPGETVGYRVRFETKVSRHTRIEIVTEGILTRMLQRDNALEEVGLVIFDEFHERSIHADLSFALCRECRNVLREDLRMLIMSATLDAIELTDKLGNAPLIVSEGRQFPIAYNYSEPDNSRPLVEEVCRVILKALREESGDMLVFLPGSGDIHRAKELLEANNIAANILPLYGDLPFDEQQAAIEPDRHGRRKIVLSTSIAETSLTIKGISVVVDSGYSRIPRYDASTGLTKLETVRSTRDTVDQRAGRAGRLGPGVCYRLWNEATNHHLAPQRSPEILQADLTPLLLELAGWGNEKPEQLEWITPPPAGAISQARQLLTDLGALREMKITPSGKAMLEFPTHPRIAHMLASSRQKGLESIASDVAALLEERDPLRRESGADLTLRIETLVNWRKRERVNADRGALERIERISKQWRKALGASSLMTTPEPTQVGELVAAAYPERIAKREIKTDRYRLANGASARLPEHDALQHAEWLAIAQMDASGKEGRIFLATIFDPAETLRAITPTENIRWSESTGTLSAKKEWLIGKLVARDEPLQQPDKNKIAAAVTAYVKKEGLHLFDRTDASIQLQARICSIRKWDPSTDLPDYSDDGIMSFIDSWGTPYFAEVKKKDDLKRLDLESMLKNFLSWEQQQSLNERLPEKIEVPSGSLIPIHYDQEGNIPVLAVRLQELFGMKESPAVDGGRKKVILHLLSPGYKPVQVTQDLHSFWEKTYHEVRKELRIRYPKHAWPEDPWTAQAVRGVPKRKS
ncbi:MAG: ATP-dependent helicase HrpB, partial [Bacteroidota bacterium]